MKKTINLTLKEGLELNYHIDKKYPKDVKWESSCFCIYYYKESVYGGPWVLASWEKEKIIKKSILIDNDIYIFIIKIKRIKNKI